jgi:hypothetical protein
MSLIQFEETVVQEAMLDLVVQKGPGLDGISPFILNKLVSVMLVPLTFLFNLSLSSDVFSAIWKEFFIFSIFKNGEKRDISCYRLKKWSEIGSHRLSGLGLWLWLWLHERSFYCDQPG